MRKKTEPAFGKVSRKDLGPHSTPYEKPLGKKRYSVIVRPAWPHDQPTNGLFDEQKLMVVFSKYPQELNLCR